jgi:hypothetical protein
MLPEGLAGKSGGELAAVQTLRAAEVGLAVALALDCGDSSTAFNGQSATGQSQTVHDVLSPCCDPQQLGLQVGLLRLTQPHSYIKILPTALRLDVITFVGTLASWCLN